MIDGRLVAIMMAVALGATASAKPAVTLGRVDGVRPDGSHLSYFLTPSTAQHQDAILVLQGTGCAPVETNANLTLAASTIDPAARGVLVEKYGVSDPAAGPFSEGCSEAFWQNETLHQRVMDALQVVAELRRKSWWSRRLVIFGGSEGGAVAALVAPLVRETAAVIIFSSGTGTPIRDLIEASSPPGSHLSLNETFAAAKADPTWTHKAGGLTYRWLAEAADIVPARSLALSPAPVLLIHGVQDRSSPVSTARAGEAVLLASGKVNVTYHEYPDFDHGMLDAHGVSHMREAFSDAGAWLHDQH